MPETGGRADAGSEGAAEYGTAETSGTKRAGDTARVGGIGEVPRPPGKRISEEERERGEGGASKNLRTVMEGMDVGGEEMDEGEGAEVKQDNGETEGGD